MALYGEIERTGKALKESGSRPGISWDDAVNAKVGAFSDNTAWIYKCVTHSAAPIYQVADLGVTATTFVRLGKPHFGGRLGSATTCRRCSRT